jgi:hypothetical protein
VPQVEAGRVKHGFTDLEKLRLLDREREDIEGESVKQKRDGVDAWLSRINDSQAQPSGMRCGTDRR